MKKSLFIIFIAIFCIHSFAQLEIVPLSVGNYWTYDDGERIDITNTIYISGKTGYIWEKQGLDWFNINEGGGLICYGYQCSSVNHWLSQPDLWMRYPGNNNDSWVSSSSVINTNNCQTISSNWSIVSNNATFSTSAHTYYHCYKYQWQFSGVTPSEFSSVYPFKIFNDKSGNSMGSSVNYKIYEYVAPDTGLVGAEEYVNGIYYTTIHLTSFHVQDQSIALLQQYAPILYFHNDEKFRPTTVDWFLQHSELVHYDFFGRHFDISHPTNLSGAYDGNYYLELDGHPLPQTVGGWAANAPKVIYGRVVPGAPGSEISMVIQYWLFYPYNEWVNLHEGDWQTIEILIPTNELDSKKVILSQKFWISLQFNWDDVDKNGSHIMINVDKGSHASIPHAESWQQQKKIYEAIFPEFSTNLFLLVLPSIACSVIKDLVLGPAYNGLEVVAFTIVGRLISKPCTDLFNFFSNLLGAGQNLKKIMGDIWSKESITQTGDNKLDYTQYAISKLVGSEGWLNYQGHWGAKGTTLSNSWYSEPIFGYSQNFIKDYVNDIYIGGPFGPLQRVQYKNPGRYYKWDEFFPNQLSNGGWVVKDWGIKLDFWNNSGTTIKLINNNGRETSENGNAIPNSYWTKCIGCGNAESIHLETFQDFNGKLRLEGTQTGGEYHLSITSINANGSTSEWKFHDYMKPGGFKEIPVNVTINNQGNASINITQPTSGILDNDHVYCYPNPFNPNFDITTIRFSLSQQGNVTVKIFDASNTLVKKYDAGLIPAGTEQGISWDGRNGSNRVVANGVYFYLIESDSGEKAIGKIAVIK